MKSDNTKSPVTNILLTAILTVLLIGAYQLSQIEDDLQQETELTTQAVATYAEHLMLSSGKVNPNKIDEWILDGKPLSNEQMLSLQEHHPELHIAHHPVTK